MKKFLIFLVSTIIIVCLGVTFYQFAKNDEVFSVTGETLYINYGETLSLDDIGFSRKEENDDTKIDFNAGGEEVASIIKFDDVKNCYVPTSKGGSTTIIISTTNSRYKRLAIDVIVGVGSEDNPYYISNESQLFNIGKALDLNAHYSLVKDIKLTSTHTPIGYDGTDEYEFTGKFNGNQHTISNLKIEKSGTNAGLFAIIGGEGSVSNLVIEDASISGSHKNAGIIAGANYGRLDRLTIVNPNINIPNSDSCGGLVGISDISSNSSVTPSIMRCYVYTLGKNSIKSTNGTTGGLVGIANSTVIHACHTDTSIECTGNFVGGLVGQFVVNNDSYIRESYSISSIKGHSLYAGGLIGCIQENGASVKSFTLLGNYYSKTNCSYKAIALDESNFAEATSYTVFGKTNSELKRKNTYIYYINSQGKEQHWDSFWFLEDGQYPVLSSGSQTTGDIDASTPGGDITDIAIPSNPSVSGKILSSKEDVVKYLQSSSVSGTYILTSDIDLGGMVWTPARFSGVLKSAEGYKYSISNFKINSNTKNVGLFSVINNATISSVEFENVSVSSGTSCAGILAGIVQGNTNISDVKITNCEISNASDYAGLLVAYISSSIVSVEKCVVSNSNISGNNSNAGGLIAYVGSNTSVKDCRADGVVVGVNKVGGISAINYGTISNCKFGGNIYSVNNSTQGYFGGGIGVNHATVKDCNANVDKFIVKNQTSSGENALYFVGGFVGYNRSGVIKTCLTSLNTITTDKSSGRVYIGGICGYNSAELTECFCSANQIGSVNSTDCVAGIVAYNYGGKISGCLALVDKLAGLMVAGIAISNSSNSTIDSCYIGENMLNRTLFTGKNIAGIVYDISSGEISNCLTNAELKCSSSDGFVVGFAMFMPYTDNKFGTISTSIANVSFTGEGYRSLLISQQGILDKKQCTGSIINSVISQDAVTSTTFIPRPSTITFIVWDIKKYKPGSNTSYQVASTQQIQNIELYLNSKLGFDINSSSTGTSKWIYFDATRIPLPRQILKATVNIPG